MMALEVRLWVVESDDLDDEDRAVLHDAIREGIEDAKAGRTIGADEWGSGVTFLAVKVRVSARTDNGVLNVRGGRSDNISTNCWFIDESEEAPSIAGELPQQHHHTLAWCTRHELVVR